MKTAADARLYDPDDAVPTLRGTHCAGCGSTFFPPLRIGCEVCGATEDKIGDVRIAAAGVLYSVATVHLHADGDGALPFAVADVQLDEGPLIRGIMAEPASIDAIGRRVEARWAVVRTDGDGNEVVEPRFVLTAPAGSQEGAR
jgi:uncharacterized OB-fold protein